MSARQRKQTAPGPGRPRAVEPKAAGRAARAGGPRLLLPGVGFLGGCALAGAVAVVGFRHTGQPVVPAAIAAPAPPLAQDQLLSRITALEAALDQARHAAADSAGALSRRIEQAEALRAPDGDRFVAAALLLMASIATPRPWLREYEALARLAPPGALPPPLAEVLLSHAARGLPTEAELRDRYAVLAPQLLERAPRQGDTLRQALSTMRAAAAGIGLASAPQPSDQEQAVQGVARHLQRGNLAAAVADAAALDASLQPLLAGWLAQASARLAVEQAVRETLLRMLAAPAQPS